MNSRVIGLLGRALQLEMESAQQHMTRASLAGLWRDQRLADTLTRLSDEEMGHADLLTRQMLLLGYAPPGLSLDPVRPGRDPEEILALSRAHEWQTVRFYEESAHWFRRFQPDETGALFAYLLEQEMGHARQLGG
ncbi:MAG: bacterioferritin [Halothiobacillaceae bacterium]|nr:bacterioferritin [Halothiobacillaceae bacterium]